MKTVLSFYDYTGEALKPWAEAGYECFAYDIQHDGFTPTELFDSGGCIRYMMADLHDEMTWQRLLKRHADDDIALVMGFPVCTDLAGSGACHWAKKAEINPNFQIEAVNHAKRIALFADDLNVPWMVENPVGRLSTMWRKPNFYFQPWHFGGYIDMDEAEHPLYPSHIAPRDAYPKKTGIWSGGGFKEPSKRPVCPEVGYSRQHLKLGGKSAKTKNIRSATPRGFARAVFNTNHA